MGNVLEEMEQAERKLAKQRRIEDGAKLERLERAAWKFYENHGSRQPHAGLIHDAARAALRWHKHQDGPGPGMTAPWVEGYISATVKMVEMLVRDDGVRMAYLSVLCNANLIIMDSFVGEDQVAEAERRLTDISMRGSVDR